MLRECQHYYQELKSCESLTGRFNQYYIEGKSPLSVDCGHWREDHEDCKVASHFVVIHTVLVTRQGRQAGVSIPCPAR